MLIRFNRLQLDDSLEVGLYHRAKATLLGKKRPFTLGDRQLGNGLLRAVCIYFLSVEYLTLHIITIL